jgi:hypothetical protein
MKRFGLGSSTPGSNLPAVGGVAADLPQKRDAQSFTRSYLPAPGRGSFLNNTRATKGCPAFMRSQGSTSSNCQL